ncbi:MAG: pyruvate kinase [Thermodesulfobacteriota bacterium]
MKSSNKRDDTVGVSNSNKSDLGKSQKELLYLVQQLKEIRSEIMCFADNSKETLHEMDPTYEESAKNLLHYLTFRRHDLRELQSELAELGLSSLGRSESHVLATVDAVLLTLARLADFPIQITGNGTDKLDFKSARKLLEEHTKTLLGPAPQGRNVYIMVTMPSEAAHDYELVLCLLNNGMNCMRINCAHDDPKSWSHTIANLRRAREQTQKPCKIIMDLPGPKLRTGPVSPGPSVIKYRPERDAYGHVTKPASVLLTSADSEEIANVTFADAVLPIRHEWLKKLHVGDTIKFIDARGARRSMKIRECTEEGYLAEASKTAYITPGTLLSCYREGAFKKQDAEICGFQPRESSIRISQGDVLILTHSLTPGRPAEYDTGGNAILPAQIGCTIPEILKDVKKGDPIWFDDGKIGGVVEDKIADGIKIRITHTNSPTAKLGSDKGINLPESNLNLPALTSDDIPILEFIIEHADIVAMSFVNTPDDVKSLIDHIKRSGSNFPSIVLKIETRRGFENLPAMLLEAMKSPSCGVMIARGDLAVESGFERLAEVQEEILWLCEAAHVPAIWATQVLESLAKLGSPTRAEITDAAMGHRAECVMLNKGPHILEALKALDNILRRMETHQFKKMSMLRELRLAYNFPK